MYAAGNRIEVEYGISGVVEEKLAREMEFCDENRCQAEMTVPQARNACRPCKLPLYPAIHPRRATFIDFMTKRHPVYTYTYQHHSVILGFVNSVERRRNFREFNHRTNYSTVLSYYQTAPLTAPPIPPTAALRI